MRMLRRVSEEEVIADFLQSEFYHAQYEADRDQFASIVRHPDLDNPAENATRKALLFRRRDTMWWELPDDRTWWELDFTMEDIPRVSVFPRAHWRTVARGDFNAMRVAEILRQGLSGPAPSELAVKIATLSERLQGHERHGTVMLLGKDEQSPLTLLEGNHRFVAFLLAPSQAVLRRFRMVGAFSPNMDKCCWYKTNFFTLARCLKNRIQHFWDRDTDLKRLLGHVPQSQTLKGKVGPTGEVKPT